MAVYGRRTESLSSRMSNYGGSDENPGGMSGMFEALGGVADRYREKHLNPAEKERVEGPTGKVIPAKKAHYGEYEGPDVLKGQSLGDAWGNVRKYFGDRLNSMQKNQQPTTGGGSVANTAIQTADPSTVKATAEGAQEGANTMEAKMADYRSRDWDPSAKNTETGEYEEWYDPNQAEQYGWKDGKWQDPQQQAPSVMDNVNAWVKDKQDKVDKNPDGTPKVISGTAPLPFLDGFGSLGEAWDGVKSLWGGLGK